MGIYWFQLTRSALASINEWLATHSQLHTKRNSIRNAANKWQIMKVSTTSDASRRARQLPIHALRVTPSEVMWGYLQLGYVFMVLNACDSDSPTEPAERVSPSCRTVTQSPRAMNESSISARGQRKYRTTRPYEDEVERSDDEPRIGSPTSMNTHREPAEGSGDTSPRVDGDGSSSSGAKKKGLQKLASGAIANIGSVFRGGTTSGESEGRNDLSAGRASKNSSKGWSNTPDFTIDSDSGMQEKLSPPSQKEKFFQKGWRNRLKVIPNAGNALWIPQVWLRPRSSRWLLNVAFLWFAMSCDWICCNAPASKIKRKAWIDLPIVKIVLDRLRTAIFPSAFSPLLFIPRVLDLAKISSVITHLNASSVLLSKHFTSVYSVRIGAYTCVYARLWNESS